MCTDGKGYSFSKVIVPGMRLGWITCSPFFAEKLEILTDSSTQHPHGMGQAFIAELFGEKGWGYSGFFKWIRSLCNDYQRRRDLLLSVFEREMDGSPFASVNVPSAGMFVWVEIHYEHHPYFTTVDEKIANPSVESMNMDLFQKAFEGGVVVMPAQTFAIATDEDLGFNSHEVSKR